MAAVGVEDPAGTASDPARGPTLVLGRVKIEKRILDGCGALYSRRDLRRFGLCMTNMVDSEKGNTLET